jgi:hypothetical protein
MAIPSNRIAWHVYLLFARIAVLLFGVCYLIAISNHPSSQQHFPGLPIHGAILLCAQIQADRDELLLVVASRPLGPACVSGGEALFLK